MTLKNEKELYKASRSNLLSKNKVIENGNELNKRLRKIAEDKNTKLKSQIIQ